MRDGISKPFLLCLFFFMICLLYPMSCGAGEYGLPVEEVEDGLDTMDVISGSPEDELEDPEDYSDLMEEELKQILNGQLYADVDIVENPDLALSYNENTGMFRYILPDGEYFEINVPLGGWARTRAYLKTSEGLNVYQIWRDGELVSVGGMTEFLQVGDYEITVMDNELGTSGSTGYKLSISFHLYLNERLNLTHINVPMGLFLEDAVLDGVSLEGITGREHYLHLEKDGRYVLRFADGEGKRCFQMEFVRDTVPPALYFDCPVDGMVLTEPVSFTLLERQAQIEIWRNLQTAYATSNVIAMRGDYRMEISDDAGNVRDYEFTLHPDIVIWDKRLLIIPCVALVAVVVSFFYWRRNMRVI